MEAARPERTSIEVTVRREGPTYFAPSVHVVSRHHQPIRATSYRLEVCVPLVNLAGDGERNDQRGEQGTELCAVHECEGTVYCGPSFTRGVASGNAP